MNDREWAAFAAEVDNVFRGDFGPTGPDDLAGHTQEASYRRHLGDLEYDVAAAAVVLLVNEGQVFLPTAGELKRAALRVTTRRAVPFAEAWRVIDRELRRRRPSPTASEAAHRAADVAFVAAVAEQLGEGAARWVESRGRRALGQEEVDGEYRGAVFHRLEREYAAFVEQAEEDQRVGLALERVGRRVELGRAQGPRRLGDALPQRAELPEATT